MRESTVGRTSGSEQRRGRSTAPPCTTDARKWPSDRPASGSECAAPAHKRGTLVRWDVGDI